jgi:hypothetical protein
MKSFRYFLVGIAVHLLIGNVSTLRGEDATLR